MVEGKDGARKVLGNGMKSVLVLREDGADGQTTLSVSQSRLSALVHWHPGDLAQDLGFGERLAEYIERISQSNVKKHTFPEASEPSLLVVADTVINQTRPQVQDLDFRLVSRA